MAGFLITRCIPLYLPGLWIALHKSAAMWLGIGCPLLSNWLTLVWFDLVLLQLARIGCGSCCLLPFLISLCVGSWVLLSL